MRALPSETAPRSASARESGARRRLHVCRAELSAARALLPILRRDEIADSGFAID